MEPRKHKGRWIKNQVPFVNALCFTECDCNDTSVVNTAKKTKDDYLH